MRVTTNQIYSQSLNRIFELQKSSIDIQRQVATGKRITQPGDDPVAAATVLQINERLQAVDQYERNGVIAEQRLTQVDDVFGGVSHVLQRTRELLIQGRSEALGASDRRAVAAEIREQLDVLVDLGNTRNASGEYVFAGAAVTTRPFTRDALGNVSYNGDQTVRRIQVSETRQVEESFTGEEAFIAIRNGNGTFVADRNPANVGTAQVSDNVIVNGSAYLPHDFRINFTSATTYDVIDDTAGSTVLGGQTYVDGAAINFAGMAVTVIGAPQAGDEFSIRPSANQSMFATVKDIAQALETDFQDPAGAARFGFDMDRAIEDLDQAMEKVAELRSSTGARLNTIEAQRNNNEDSGINLQTLRSNLEDVDLTAAISKLAQQTTALEAAQAAFVRVQDLSLFDYL
ncbi:MAG: flagellar hook-associated protein FlgL [Gammaproteobacteria bacterium]|nr:flagellar hook-associated protein FlgL [Gammaproteobacteria bacterium]MCP5202299.1 flagellar hook-associated protein FlgL [Gammaproteobacteria bacterium]